MGAGLCAFGATALARGLKGGAMCRPAVRVTTEARGPRFIVGRDEKGQWLVTDREGLIGGLFVDRAAAMRFAQSESDHSAGAVFCVPETIRLSLGTAYQPDEDTREGGSRRSGTTGA